MFLERLGLVSALKITYVSGLGFRDFPFRGHPCNASGLKIEREENSGSENHATRNKEVFI